MTASIGVAVYPIDGREHSELLQRSDFAMFRNKGDMSNRPSISGSTRAPSAPPRDHTWDRLNVREQKDGSPPGECCGEPKYDENAVDVPCGSPGTLDLDYTDGVGW